MQSRRGNAVFTLIVGVATFVGGGLMALVLTQSGAPAGLAVGVVLAAVPVMPLLTCYLWLDRYEPEPRSLLVSGLAWGALVATALALIVQTADSYAFDDDLLRSGVLVAPLSEEAAKGLFILLLLWFRRNELDGVLDGIVYAGMVGIGFAFTENILYLAGAYVGTDEVPGGLEQAVVLFVLRCVFGAFAHPAFTAFIGIGIGLAVNSRRGSVRLLAPILGYAAAVAAHALWNGSVFYRGGSYAVVSYFLLILPAFGLLLVFAIWVRKREGRLLAAALDDCATRGFLHPYEVPWLVRIPARSAARRYARSVGGDPALKAMKDYQTAAIELGYLHHRFLNGKPPADYDLIGQGHLEELVRLRPYVIWPQSVSGAQAGGGAR